MLLVAIIVIIILDYFQNWDLTYLTILLLTIFMVDEKYITSHFRQIYENFSDEKHRLNRRLSKIENKIDFLKGAIGSLEDTISSLEDEVNSVGRSEISSLEETVNEMKKTLDDIDKSVTEMEENRNDRRLYYEE